MKSRNRLFAELFLYIEDTVSNIITHETWHEQDLDARDSQSTKTVVINLLKGCTSQIRLMTSRS